jgi:hypothetical protein
MCVRVFGSGVPASTILSVTGTTPACLLALKLTKAREKGVFGAIIYGLSMRVLAGTRQQPVDSPGVHKDWCYLMRLLLKLQKQTRSAHYFGGSGALSNTDA